ncbi:acyltransferase family protein [Microbacterium rhizophilus]|uniref:acyltransferase family protein n=1 Tax=Microbacterium rhizophilus TaxID=3138934 RepID=UPI0031F0A782
MTQTVSATRAPEPAALPAIPRRKRLDIQGLRALAVLAVLANHLWEQRLPGGYVGVDIFFVISGFLITGLLLREYERSGTISFRRFYLRRAKRLVPAALLVILATVAVSFAVITADLARGIAWDGVWALFFGENWHLIAKSTDYFAQSDGATPLQHYWSLSVEEQFYLVWPWLLLGLLALFVRGARSSPRRIRLVAGTAISVVIALSFGWALVQSTAEPGTAYFSTLTRGWELGLGALVAVISPVFARLPGWSRTVLAYAGLAAMLAAILLFDAATVWPAPNALLPTLGAAAVIVSGIGAEARGNVLLTNRAAVYIGDISYSLYLWHLPLIFFATVRFPDAGRVADVAVIVASFALAIATFHAIEGPIHHSPIAERPRRSWAEWWGARRKGVVRGGVAFAATAACLVALFVAVPAKSALAMVPAAALRAPDADPDVVAALRLTSWPETITPSLDSSNDERYAKAWVEEDCLIEGMAPQDRVDEVAERCVFGDPSGARTVVVLGDSVAISWEPALEAALDRQGWRIIVFAAGMCPIADVEVEREGTGTPFPGCAEFRHRAIEKIEEIRPDLVVATETSSTMYRLSSGATGDARKAEFAEGVARTAAALQAAAGDVVVVETLPKTRKISGCYSPFSGPAACTRKVEPATLTHRNWMSAATNAADVPYVDPVGLFCVADVCPPVVSGYLTRPDGVHMSDAYARHIGARFWDLVTQATAR